MTETSSSDPRPSELLSKKAAKAVSEVLGLDERVITVLSGFMGEALVGTNQRLHIFKRFAGVYSLEAGTVGGIELQPSGATGKVLVFERAGDGELRALKQQTVIVGAKDYADAQEVVAELQSLFGIGEGTPNANRFEVTGLEEPLHSEELAESASISREDSGEAFDGEDGYEGDLKSSTTAPHLKGLSPKFREQVTKTLDREEEVLFTFPSEKGLGIVATDERILQGQIFGRPVSLDYRQISKVELKEGVQGTAKGVQGTALIYVWERWKDSRPRVMIFLRDEDRGRGQELVERLRMLAEQHDDGLAQRAASPEEAVYVEGVPPPLAKLNRKASEAVSAELLPDEEVRVIVTGSSGQAILGTDRRAFVYKKGVLAGATLGRKLTTYEYEHISGIELHLGMSSGAVVIRAPGEISVRTSAWSNKKDSPNEARNAIPVQRRRDVEAQVRSLRELVAAWNRSEHTPSKHETEQPDTLGQIERLGQLRDRGLLSDDEFESKKAELLKRL
jgi:hypothetical protein